MAMWHVVIGFLVGTIVIIGALAAIYGLIVAAFVALAAIAGAVGATVVSMPGWLRLRRPR